MKKIILLFLICGIILSVAHGNFVDSDDPLYGKMYLQNNYIIYFNETQYNQIEYKFKQNDNEFFFTFLEIVKIEEFGICQASYYSNNLEFNILTNSFVKYKLFDNRIKQYIIINNEDSSVPINKNITLKSKINPSKNLEIFIDSKKWNESEIETDSFDLRESGNKLFIFSKIYIQDDNNNKLYLKYKLNKIGNNIFIESKIDKDWWNNATFPITIDPSYFINNSNMSNYYSRGFFIYSGDHNITNGMVAYILITGSPVTNITNIGNYTSYMGFYPVVTIPIIPVVPPVEVLVAFLDLGLDNVFLLKETIYLIFVLLTLILLYFIIRNI